MYWQRGYDDMGKYKIKADQQADQKSNAGAAPLYPGGNHIRPDKTTEFYAKECPK